MTNSIHGNAAKANRVQMTDNMMTAVMKLSEGNPGAAMALIELEKYAKDIDRQNMLGGLSYILELDSLGIYGADIYVLYSDLCRTDLPKTMALITAVQLGILDKDLLKDACSRQDYSGRELIDIDKVYNQVKEQLPKFNYIGFTR